MHFNMMSHVIFTLRWLPNPLSMHVDPSQTPHMRSSSIASSRSCRLSLSTFSISFDSHWVLMNVEIIGANCRATGLPLRSSFSLTTSFSSRVRAHPTDTCGKPPFRIFRLDAEELPDILYGVHHLPSTLVVTSPNVPWMCWSHPYPVHTCPPFDSLHLIIFRSRRDVKCRGY